MEPTKTPNDAPSSSPLDEDLPLPRPLSSEATLLISEKDHIFHVKIQLPEAAENFVRRVYLDGITPQPRTALTVDFQDYTLTIFPQSTFLSDRLYGPKYAKLRSIEIGMPLDFHFPDNQDDIAAILAELPSGFIKDPAFGFGFIKEMKPLVKAIEQVPGVSRLVIVDHEPTRVERDTFYLNARDYDDLRAATARIARYHQIESLTDREILAHNATAHKVLPEKFPFKERPYRPGTIFKMLGGSQSALVNLRGKDRLGVLNALAGNAEAIAKRDPREFAQLQRDIETVSLDQLIVSVEQLIRQNGAESRWQDLLELNPFLLSMLFGQPIVLLQSEAAVGGQRMTRHGTKITDFLTKNPLTDNASLVELKRPRTRLLGKAYRPGVYPPSTELMSAVTQVLDQRLKLMTDIATTMRNNRISDLEVASVECVIVAGRTPPEPDAVNSLEMIRTQFKDVRIITFDELLERLHLLRELLTGERYVSNLDDEEPDDDWLENSEEEDATLDESDDEDWEDVEIARRFIAPSGKRTKVKKSGGTPRKRRPPRKS